jgi:hypothetical protein
VKILAAVQYYYCLHFFFSLQLQHAKGVYVTINMYKQQSFLLKGQDGLFQKVTVHWIHWKLPVKLHCDASMKVQTGDDIARGGEDLGDAYQQSVMQT